VSEPNRFPTPPMEPANWTEAIWQSRNYTCGNYATEADAAAAFDALVPTYLFTIHREVTGRLSWPLFGQQKDRRVRVDRLLEPTSLALDLGWGHGVLGVELKRSHLKVGRPINQMLDYLRSTFMLEGREVQLGYVLLFPYGGPGGGKMVSVFHGQRLGCAYEADGRLIMCRPGAAPSGFLIEEDVFGALLPSDLTKSSKVGSR